MSDTVTSPKKTTKRAKVYLTREEILRVRVAMQYMAEEVPFKWGDKRDVNVAMSAMRKVTYSLAQFDA